MLKVGPKFFGPNSLCKAGLRPQKRFWVQAYWHAGESPAGPLPLA